MSDDQAEVDTRHEALGKLHAGTTRGEWHGLGDIYIYAGDDAVADIPIDDDEGWLLRMRGVGRGATLDEQKRNLAFMVAAHNELPALLADYAAMRAERDALHARLPPEWFPVLGEGWRMPLAMLAPHGPQAKINHDQSLEKLASRGGMDSTEILAVLDGRKWTRMNGQTAKAELQRRVKAWTDEHDAASAALSALQSEQVRADVELLRGESYSFGWTHLDNKASLALSRVLSALAAIQEG